MVSSNSSVCLRTFVERMCRKAAPTNTIIISGITASNLYWCMNFTIPSAVYAHVIDAAAPPINVAANTLVNCILDNNPNIAPTSTPDAINGIQTNTIRPQNPHLLIISRFSFAMYSTVDNVFPMKLVCNILPPRPSCLATATILSSFLFLLALSTLPAPERSAKVET